jgi:hypothetical protein
MAYVGGLASVTSPASASVAVFVRPALCRHHNVPNDFERGWPNTDQRSSRGATGLRSGMWSSAEGSNLASGLRHYPEAHSFSIDLTRSSSIAGQEL